ncbi:MAG TPA: TonB-dependent receptor [bacterium]
MIHLFREKFRIAFLSCLFTFLISGQSFSRSIAAETHLTDTSRLTGLVIDETSQTPIANVNIYFEATQIGTTSDQSGNFFIENVPAGQKILLVTHIGYVEKRIQLKLASGETRNLNILLMPKALKLGEIVFTASRHAETVFKSQMNVAIAKQEKIAIRTSPNTADALREIPGVLVQKTTAGHGAPVIRGMIGKDVLLLYNGIRLNKPTFRFGANQYMNTINVESLDRIEVTKGPGSVMYGSDAIGGVVNMISEPSQIGESGNGFGYSVSSRYGSADQSRLVNAAFGNNLSGIEIKAGFGLKEIGDLTAGKDIGKQVPTGYDEWNANFKLSAPVNPRTSLEFDFLTVQQDEVPRFDRYVTREYEIGEYEIYLYDPQNRYLASIGLRSQPINLSWISSIKWNFSYQFEQEGTIERKTGSNTVTKNRNDLATLGSYLQINSIWRNLHVLSYGYEFYWDRLKSSRIQEKNDVISSQRGDYPDGSEYHSLGLFLNDNLLFSTRLDMNIGLRWSNVGLSSQLEQPFGKFDDNYSDLTGTIGLSYKPKLWLNFIARYAKGFRAPNFNDTIVLKVSNAGVDAPSPGLSPEKSHNFEIGVKLNKERLTGSLFLFYNRVLDLIDRYRGTYNGLDFYDENGNGIQDSGEADIFQKRNVARGYLAGWELDGKVQVSDQWSMKGFAFWTYGQDLTFDEPLSRIPPLMGMAAIQFSPTKKLSLEAFFRAATKQDRLSSRDKDDNRIPLGGTPGWTTLNFRCSWEIRQPLKLNLMLENIFNETYKEHGSGVYSPGRNFVIGLRYGI